VVAIAVSAAALAYGLKSTEYTPSDAWWVPVSLVTSRLGGVLLLLAVAGALAPRAVLVSAVALMLTTFVYTTYATFDVIEESRFWFFLLSMLGMASTALLAAFVSETALRLRGADVAPAGLGDYVEPGRTASSP
jgi:hypothetical protein